MNARSRLGGFWATVRPRTRRGAVRSVIAIVVGAIVLSAVLFVGAAMAWSPYVTFSLNHDADAATRAAMPLSYAPGGTCNRCHTTESGRLTTAGHASIGCQSCHGALIEHADAADPRAVTVTVPTDAVCIRCHTQAEGRPAGFRQIVPTQHYVSACLACHDPHTAIAKRPPVVLHPLDNLPPCLTCHGPDGFKARNQRHPVIDNDDKACLECHGAGRGPAADVVTP